MPVFCRRGTNNFVQIATLGDTTLFANFNLLTGVVGNTSASVSETITLWRNEFYRCTLATSSTIANGMIIAIISYATASRAETNTLTTNIYIAGAQVEDGEFATSFIPTEAPPVTREGDFASIEESNFTPWYNPVQGAFVIEL